MESFIGKVGLIILVFELGLITIAFVRVSISQILGYASTPNVLFHSFLIIIIIIYIFEL